MNNMIWKKLIAVFAFSLLLCVSFIIARAFPTFAGEEAAPLTTNHLASIALPEAPLGGGADMLPATGQTLVLGMDATLSFRAEPCGEFLPEPTIATNSMVEMVGKRMACGHLWYWVRQADGTEGWLSCAVLATPDAPCFADAFFCTGALCGEALSLGAEQLSLTASLSGVREGELVQYVLLVNEERYASPLLTWTTQGRGQQTLNLFDFGPRLEAGHWSIHVYVEGELVGSAEVQMHRPAPVDKPEA